MIDAIPDAGQALVFDCDRETTILEHASRPVMKPATYAQNHHGL
jgi:hypothetical protein